MTDSIGDILGGRARKEPAESIIIRGFLHDKFQANATVTMQERQIIIGVKSAALAGTLRMHLHELKELCQTEKRLVIRIN